MEDNGINESEVIKNVYLIALYSVSRKRTKVSLLENYYGSLRRSSSSYQQVNNNLCKEKRLSYL